MSIIKKGVRFLFRLVINILPRYIRIKMIRELITKENMFPPKQAVINLFEIYDFTCEEIDRACILWGNGSHIKHELMDGIHSFFYTNIPDSSKVLDLGCGIGRLAYELVANRNVDVLGIDMNERSIDFARNNFKHPRLHFQVGNVFSDIPQNEKFDVIVLSSVLEHLNDRSEFLQKIIQIFNPDSILIRVPLFEQHYFKAIKRDLGLFAYADATHVLEYSLESFYSEMMQAKLFVKHIEIRWGDIWALCVPIEKGAENDIRT